MPIFIIIKSERCRILITVKRKRCQHALLITFKSKRCKNAILIAVKSIRDAKSIGDAEY